MPNGRCRMHGGNCRGPATPEGRDRMTAANTKHGNYSAHARAERHHVRTFTTRHRLTCAATLLWRCLPPDMAARLAQGPPELFAPVHPSNLPYLTPRDAIPHNVKTRRGKPAPCPTGRAAERLAIRAEAAAQAPWRQAIAQARASATTTATTTTATTTTPSPLEGEGLGEGSRRNAVQRETTSPPGEQPAAATSPPTRHNLTVLQRELAARLAGLRAQRSTQPPTDAPLSPQAEPKSPGHNATQREPIARLPACQTKTPERNAVQRENPAPPAPINRAARRRLKHLQRRRARTARPRPQPTTPPTPTR
jgi:hypothetical protein